MECTQRLECSQQYLSTQTERECPEQIGFIGICGEKYAVKIGQNNIGRDPKTCSIVLNWNSVSRLHAVIHVLHKKKFTLSDLNSANKTKLSGVTLRPFVPQPLKHGDTVQFGELYGTFQLLEYDDDDDLPMTQVLPMTQPMHIPDTPMPTKHASKLNSVTTIPESPDVSDKDDSLTIASHPKGHELKNTNHLHNFIKPGKTIWNSSKKSTSLNLDDSTSTPNDSIPFIKLNEKENEADANNIHEMDTQALPPRIQHDSIYEANTQLPVSPTLASIYTANTQLPGTNDVSPSIYTANTQIPDKSQSPSTSIHSLDTQLPPNLPDIYKINEQQDMQFDLCADKNICNLGTHEVDSESDDDIFGSQANIEDVISLDNKVVDVESEMLSQIPIPKSTKRNMRLKSDSSTDCDDVDNYILSSQNIPAEEVKVDNDGDSTDCEDEMIELKTNIKHDNIIEALDLEEAATQVIEVLDTSLAKNEDFADMSTQVIDVGEKNCDKDASKDLEDLSTLVLVEDDVPPKLITKSLLPDDVEISPFKIPLKSACKWKKKDASKSVTVKAKTNFENKPTASNEDNRYYQATQDIYEDLCTQNIPEMPSPTKKSCDFRNEKGLLSPSNKSDESPNNSSTKENVNTFVSTLTSQDVREIIGVEAKVAPLKKVSSNGSDASDLEVTPKKIRPYQFTDIDLPNSQEIKTIVSLSTKSIATESSSESDTEQNSEDQCTPILFRKKKKPKRDAKMDLTKRFDVEALPTRIITRVRRPTSKLKNEDNKILKPKFLNEQDDEIDKEIISENITRLKIKNEKSKNVKDKPEKLKCFDSTKSKDNVTKESTNNNKKDSKSKSKTDDNIVKLKHESEVKVIAEKSKTQESRREKRSASPVKPDNIDIVLKDSQETLNESSNVLRGFVEDIELSKVNDNKMKIREAKCNISTTVKEEKPRGPVIIEPHIITVPVKVERKKREYTRKTKETADTKIKLVDHDAVQSTSKVVNAESKRPVRTTRGKKKISDDFIDFTEEDSQTARRSKRTNRVSKEPSPKIEVRRSKRQKTIKEKEEPAKVKEAGKVKEPVKVPALLAKEPVKSVLKKSSAHEQSTVYNLSAGSELPVNLKRPAEVFEALAPATKRTRADNCNTSRRATPARMQKTYVLFTAFPYEEVKSKLEKLGAVVVTDVTQCTVLLTVQIKRTFKLLCAVGLGKPIVGPNWVQACVDTNMIVDPWLYLIKDEAAEKRFSFTLKRTIIGKRNFLKGYNISATPSVMPQASEMKLIVQCSGGAWREGGARWLCLTCGADRALWRELNARGATLVTTELILSGVLRQALDIPTNRVDVQ